MTPERLAERRMLWKRLCKLCAMRAALQTDYFDDAINDLETALRQKEGIQIGNTLNTSFGRFRLAKLSGSTRKHIFRGRIQRKQSA
ncbi:hypothetical protein ABE82_07285 [Paenibacillus peoriae]|nr:hypothetical protein ABE82_07285 [Paenibacillus peoriae]